ncbi:uncharacterized protein FMAN_02125 [Fusarium mangiferae]|uniref:Uncharacterized protein n=1 Tax=Fusarium mangiferae TaxID=192010 RepID=A0A1L7TKP4_FUSMA|nr:uncharacterized protein FMAN_02125 [Fusarium mangiferae]CVK99248.1 uncharacterized protein FMAN_02125 [Fusarium mangiferae]
MSHLPASDTQQLITKINGGSFLLGDLSVERCPKLETGEVTSEVLKQVYAQMVDEVFKTFHLDKTEAMLYFKRCVKKLAAVELQEQTGQPACIPAPHLVSVIVLLTIRRARINTDRFAKKNQPFARLFRHCQMAQWLPIAVKYYEQMHNESFILKTNQNTKKPVITQKTQDGHEVWVVYTSGHSPSGPRTLPAQIVEQIKGLETPTDPDITMSGNDVVSADSNDPQEDQPISVILATTRSEAMQSGAEVLGKLFQPGVDQASLKLEFDLWLSEPHICVMPRGTKNDLFFWCDHHSRSWCTLIRSCLDEDRETWILETEVPSDSNLTIPKGGDLDFLRLYGQLATKAFLLKSSNPEEASRLMERVGNGIRLFAAKACEKQATVEEVKKRLVEMAKVCEGMADTMGQLDDQRRAKKAEIAELWSMHVHRTGNVPDCLRRIALANCTPEEMQELNAITEPDAEDSSQSDSDWGDLQHWLQS